MHHVADVVGSSLCIVVATLIALAVTPTVVPWISPYVPRSLSGAVSVSPQRRSRGSGGLQRSASYGTFLVFAFQ